MGHRLPSLVVNVGLIKPVICGPELEARCHVLIRELVFHTLRPSMGHK
jgi:hypothetical protein